MIPSYVSSYSFYDTGSFAIKMKDLAADELRELFEATVHEHDENPVGLGLAEDPTHESSAYNPICGDRYVVRFQVEDDVIEVAGFDGRGCAVSRASMSMMSSFATGRPTSQVAEAARNLKRAIESGECEPFELGSLGDAAVLVAVRRSPHRARCALLAWEAALRALES